MNNEARGVQVVFLIGLGLLLVYAVLVFLPWILVYPVALGAGSAGLGWGWFRLTRSEDSGLTSLERLAVLIPASAFILGLGLYLTKPQIAEVAPYDGGASEFWAQGRGEAVNGADQRKSKKKERASTYQLNPRRLLGDSIYEDSWNTITTTAKEMWLSMVFPFPRAQAVIGLNGRMSFCYDHEVVLVVLMFLVGAPASFFVFFKKGWSEREHELISKNISAESKFRSEIAAINGQKNEEKRKIEAFKVAKNQVIYELQAEIERLKLRDRYLSEGKPALIEGQVEKPDLGFL